MLRNRIAPLALVWALITLTSCSRSAFPVGSWRISQQNFLASATSIVILRPDHSGTIDVQAQALLDSENHHSNLRWNYAGGILRLLPEGVSESAAPSLVLVAKTEASVTWRGPDGSLVEWHRLGDASTP